MWMRGHIISESLRVRVYNAFILPILLYNSGTWGLTPVQMRNIDTFHRRQLRIVIGVRYPQIITNADLYRRTGSQPVSALIRLARLKLLGHICRLPGEAPAQEAMSAYYVREGGEKRFRGRPPSTLPIVLAIELSGANISLKSTQDLQRSGNRQETGKSGMPSFKRLSAHPRYEGATLPLLRSQSIVLAIIIILIMPLIMLLLLLLLQLLIIIITGTGSKSLLI